MFFQKEPRLRLFFYGSYPFPCPAGEFHRPYNKNGNRSPFQQDAMGNPIIDGIQHLQTPFSNRKPAADMSSSRPSIRRSKAVCTSCRQTSSTPAARYWSMTEGIQSTPVAVTVGDHHHHIPFPKADGAFLETDPPQDARRQGGGLHIPSPAGFDHKGRGCPRLVEVGPAGVQVDLSHVDGGQRFLPGFDQQRGVHHLEGGVKPHPRLD